MLSLGNPASSGVEFFDSRGCATSPPDYSFPQRFREVMLVRFTPAVRVNLRVATDSLSRFRAFEHVVVFWGEELAIRTILRSVRYLVGDYIGLKCAR